MAGSSMKDIRTRIKSIENTEQITKAMELVASSKLRKARERVERSRPFFKILQEVIADIAVNNTEMQSPYTMKRDINKICYIVIGGDRGLAGGYNNNIFNFSIETFKDREVVVLPIGKRAYEYFSNKKCVIFSDKYQSVEEITVSTCHDISKEVISSYLNNEFDEVKVIYTRFVSVLAQEPSLLGILPVNEELYNNDIYGKREAKTTTRSNILYEPGSGAVFHSIIPDYIAGIVWGSVCESVVSEHGARRTAMEAATNNAKEMIEDLSLKYNRARQGAITQEITEIVSGSEG